MAVAHVRSDTLTGLPYTTMPDATTTARPTDPDHLCKKHARVGR